MSNSNKLNQQQNAQPCLLLVDLFLAPGALALAACVERCVLLLPDPMGPLKPRQRERTHPGLRLPDSKLRRLALLGITAISHHSFKPALPNTQQAARSIPYLQPRPDWGGGHVNRQVPHSGQGPDDEAWGMQEPSEQEALPSPEPLWLVSNSHLFSKTFIPESLLLYLP